MIPGTPAVLSNVFAGGSLTGSISWCRNVSADIVEKESTAENDQM